MLERVCNRGKTIPLASCEPRVIDDHEASRQPLRLDRVTPERNVGWFTLEFDANGKAVAHTYEVTGPVNLGASRTQEQSSWNWE